MIIAMIRKKIREVLLSDYNPLVKRHKKVLRKNLKNNNMTFLCPNCTGGILFHDLGLRFNSPTINLTIFQDEFLKFVTNLDYYLEQDLNFFNSDEYDCPCAMLDDILIQFTHYRTEEEAKKKWIERCKRIDRDNMFVFMTQYKKLSREDVLKLGNIKARGVAILTGHDYGDIPYAYQLDDYKKDDAVGNILLVSHLTGKRKYEYYFDFVKWFNEADGTNYDISPYIIKH